MRDEKCVQGLDRGKMKIPVEDLVVDGRMLQWVLGERGMKLSTGFIWSRTGAGTI
jgi:hypothetical protein